VTPISRRAVLRGLGVAVALPWLEAMTPVWSAPAKAAPRRVAFLYVPNGIHMPDWTPAAEGASFELPWIGEPLGPFRDRLTFLTGLACDKARPHGDGPGDHARAMSAFLTCSQPRKTNGADIKVGVSVDQVLAKHTGTATRFPSLEIGCDSGRDSGNCDSGYSCAYSNNLSWRNESTPNPKEVNPKALFERLFGKTPGATPANEPPAWKEHTRRSILDFVREDARRLQADLGQTDRRKLDDYLTAVREVERRIANAPKAPDKSRGGRAAGVPGDYEEHVHLLCDVLALAFQTDQTRVATFALANEGSNRAYRSVGVGEGHHELSHHQNDAKKQEKLRKINRFHITQLAYLLGKLQSMKEGDGTVLDNTVIVYGSGNSDGNRHNHDNLPILVAGKGGGTLRPGRHVLLPKETPLANLWLALLQSGGASAESFGDSTGALSLT
jgi:hypothetical protein